MSEVTSWSESDASNNSAAPNGFSEGMAFSGVNDSARAVMGAVKRFWGRIQGRYASTGAANAYILTPDVALAAYVQGERYSFRASFANTGACTLNISSLGAKSIKKMTASGKADLASGDIQSGQPVTVEYDGTDMVMVTPVANALSGATAGAGISLISNSIAVDPSYLRGYLSGLTLSNNSTDASNDIDTAAGVAVAGDQGAFIKLTSGLTKRLDAAWAAGTGQGGLDTGTKAANTWYYAYAIAKAGGAEADVLWSATAPTAAWEYGGANMPASYVHSRYLGAVRTDGSSNILAFSQRGDEFLWKTSIGDVSAVDPGTAAVTRTLTVPTGIVVTALMNVHFQINAASTVPRGQALISSLDQIDQAPDLVTAPGATLITARQGADNYSAAPIRVRTNKSAQVRSRVSASDSLVALRIITYGWIDTRGRLD